MTKEHPLACLGIDKAPGGGVLFTQQDSLCSHQVNWDPSLTPILLVIIITI